MKTLISLLGTILFLAVIPFSIFGQSISMDNYMKKMNFEPISGFEPTGNIETDLQSYKQAFITWKESNLIQSNWSPVDKPFYPGPEKSNHNDLCTNAEVITCGQTVSGSTSLATFDNVGFCGTSNTANGVWYSLTPPNSGVVTLSTCNQAAYDTKISVFTGDCGSLTCVGGQDDAAGCAGFTTEFSFLASAGTEYLILVHGFGIATGSFNLTVTCPSTDPDFCSNALAVTCGETVSGSTTGATIDAAPFCGTSNTAPGIWYSLTPDSDVCITLSTCNQADYDTKISVYTDGCGTLTCVAGLDDNIAECGIDFTTKLTFNGNGGTEYLILVHGFGSATGNFDLSVTCDPGPPNDDVCNATPVVVGSITPFDNTCASVQTGEPSPGAGTGTSSCNSQDGWCSFETGVQTSIWYAFQAPSSGCVSIAAEGFDTQLSLWLPELCFDFGSFTEIAANDDSGAGLSASIIEAACLTPGATYYIQIDGFAGATGTGDLQLTDCGNDPLTVDAGDCQSRFLGYGPAEEDINYLCAEGSGGFPPYTYSWSPNDFIQTNGECIAVQPDETTTYTVTVTDSKGCTVEDEVTVNVFDLAAPCNGKKNLQVCHVPPGNGGNEHEICINQNAIPSHLNNHGDRLGPCDNTCLATNPNPFVDPIIASPSGNTIETNVAKNGISALAFPNPFERTTTIRFSTPEDGLTTVEVYSFTGLRISTLFNATIQANVTQEVIFEGKDLPAGIYYYVVRNSNGIFSQGKLALMR